MRYPRLTLTAVLATIAALTMGVAVAASQPSAQSCCEKGAACCEAKRACCG